MKSSNNFKLLRFFQREGADIRYVHKLALRDALCGAVVHIPTLDGTTYPMRINDVIKPNTSKRFSFFQTYPSENFYEINLGHV